VAQGNKVFAPACRHAGAVAHIVNGRYKMIDNIRDYKIIKKIGEGGPVRRSTPCKTGDTL
jgi:hypothetical protein